jgi:hypothetical protein
MSKSEWISHNDARELVGRAFYRDDWIGGLAKEDIDLLHGDFGPKRWPRPNGEAGFFEVIPPCPKGLRDKLDAAIGRDRRMIVQLMTILEWLDQNGFAALDKQYPRRALEHAAAKIESPAPHARPPGVGKRGPVKGVIARHVKNDRSMFPQMQRLIDEGHNPAAAAELLADTDQLTGGGTKQSKATRLRKLFQAEGR